MAEKLFLLCQYLFYAIFCLLNICARSIPENAPGTNTAKKTRRFARNNEIQWNPVNTATNGPYVSGRINGVGSNFIASLF